MAAILREESISGHGVLCLLDERTGIGLTVATDSCGEISSLRYRWRGRWLEILYRANEFDPVTEGWRGRAPWLFPGVGRNYTSEQLECVKTSGEDAKIGTYRHAGRVYEIPCHGFVMQTKWRVVAASDGDNAGITCLTCSDATTKRYYPFDYELQITYTLIETGFAAAVTVRAAAANNGNMFFSLGNHLTIRAPFTQEVDFEACFVRSPGTLRHEISKQNIFSGEVTAVDYRNGVSLRRDPQLCNMVLGGFREGDYHVDFVDPASFGVRVTQRELVNAGVCARTSPQHYHFVFYGNPSCGYFCPEPWYGGPNSLNDHRGVVSLPPGDEFAWEMRVNIV